MNVQILRNHKGFCDTGICCVAARIAGALQQNGHATLVVDPAVALNGHAPGALLTIPAQPKENNGALETFFARYPQASIAWTPDRAQMDFVEDVLEYGNIKVLHLGINEAYGLTRMMSPSDSAHALNQLSPATIVVVNDPSCAAACRHGVVTKVLSQRAHEASNRDDNAAFFGAFLGAMLNGQSLPLCLDAGCRLSAASARGEWPPPASAVPNGALRTAPPYPAAAPVAPPANTEPELVLCK